MEDVLDYSRCYPRICLEELEKNTKNSARIATVPADIVIGHVKGSMAGPVSSVQGWRRNVYNVKVKEK
jgi:hypothetical protein